MKKFFVVVVMMVIVTIVTNGQDEMRTYQKKKKSNDTFSIQLRQIHPKFSRPLTGHQVVKDSIILETNTVNYDSIHKQYLDSLDKKVGIEIKKLFFNTNIKSPD